MTEKDVEILLQRSQLKTMRDMALHNVMTLAEDHIISTLQSRTAKSLRSSVEALVLMFIATAIYRQVEEKMMSDLVKDVARQALTSQDVILTVAHKLVDSDERVAPLARFVTRTFSEETGKV